MKIDYFSLLSGNDIPFTPAAITIHNPTLKEIGLLGEDTFFTGYQMLLVNKNVLTQEDKVDLDSITNFDILIAILGERNAVMQKNRNCINMVMELLFPDYEISFEKNGIHFKKDEISLVITKENYDNFQLVLKQMFSFGDDKDTPSEFNPDGEMAKRIANKLKNRHRKLASLKNEEEQTDVLGRYCSILSIGLHINLTEIMNYTLYQLFDSIKRFELKTGNDIYLQAKMAGASDLKDPEDWMKSIHSTK